MLKCHNSPVNSVDFSPDSNLILTGSNDKNMKIFSLEEKKFKGTLYGHSNIINKVKFSPFQNIIGSCSKDKTIKLWDLTKKINTITYNDNTSNIRICQVQPFIIEERRNSNEEKADSRGSSCGHVFCHDSRIGSDSPGTGSDQFTGGSVPVSELFHAECL